MGFIEDSMDENVKVMGPWMPEIQTFSVNSGEQ